MIIKKKNILTGKINEMEIPISNEEYSKIKKAIRLPKRIASKLNAVHKEFLKTGMSKYEQENLLGSIYFSKLS